MSTNSTSNDQADLASQVEAIKNNVIGEETVKINLRGISRYLYDLHAADDFEKFSMSLTARNGGKPGQSVYDAMRSSLFHLYRGYGRSMSVEFDADATVFFKGLRVRLLRQW
ncbi:hypothetical protein GQ600_27742 [Phytophthora cactorum]|nr:hypothetical protein GQ600_27742 [Phytophthora cactorum]